MLSSSLLVGQCFCISRSLAGLGGEGGFYSAGFKLKDDNHFISVGGKLVAPIGKAPDWNSFGIGLATLETPIVNVRHVLMTNRGGWWFTSAKGNNAQIPPSSPQPGMDAKPDKEMSFQSRKQESSWSFVMSSPQGGGSLLGSWDLNSHVFKHFQILIYISPGMEFDKSSFVFRNIVLKSTGTNTDWCVAPPDEQGAHQFTATGVSWTVQDDGVACLIEEITFDSL